MVRGKRPQLLTLQQLGRMSIIMTEKIKILYIIHLLGPGGTEKQLMKLVQGLDRSHFEPFVCTTLADVSHYADSLQCEIISLKVKKLCSLSFIVGFWKLFRFVWRKHIDIIQAYFYEPSYIGCLAMLFSPVKYFITCRRDLGFQTTKKNLLLRNMMNLFAKKIIANSNAIKQAVLDTEYFVKRKIEVIHNGVEMISDGQRKTYRGNMRKKMGIRADDIVVGIVGNFNRSVKRFDLFLDVAIRCINEYSNAYFVVVGYINLEGKNQMQSHALKDSNRFLEVGGVENSLPYVCAFDIGMNTSDTEGFSNAILEYMMCGVPVVATNNQGNAELAQISGAVLLSAINDSHDLAEKVQSLINNREQRGHLGDRGRNVAHSLFLMKTMVAKHEQLYSSILQR